MKLTGEDLKQITDSSLDRLALAQLLSFTKRLLTYSKELMDRLNQNPNNSSRPPSSAAPWEFQNNSNQLKNSDDSDPAVDGDHPDDDKDDIADKEEETVSKKNSHSEVNNTTPPDEKLLYANTDSQSTLPPPENKRSAGKQIGAPGFGRTQEFPITSVMYHYISCCALCSAEQVFNSQTAWTAFCSLDIAPMISGQAGIIVTNTKHVFYETNCACGHHNKTTPHVVLPDVDWPNTNISQWRLIGSRLAAMIVLLSKRYRNSRRLIREFLLEFLGIELSVGTIDQTIREAGRCVAPLEVELIEALEKSELVYVDETSWKQSGKLFWLWVFKAATVAFFAVGKRNRTILFNFLLNSQFKGVLMSDGWFVYRDYANRLRCWAHLIRKARGLAESHNCEISDVGKKMLALFIKFQNAIYDMRDKISQDIKAPSLAIQFADEIEKLKALCIAYRECKHDKLKSFSRELLHDWDVIFRQLHDPLLPLTNNEAERMLRHWVIDRRLSYGTRTHEGTRTFSLLASVIETCRIRRAPIWNYLTSVIAAARVGSQLPTLPIMQA